jgi:hypothetical protein
VNVRRTSHVPSHDWGKNVTFDDPPPRLGDTPYEGGRAEDHSFITTRMRATFFLRAATGELVAPSACGAEAQFCIPVRWADTSSRGVGARPRRARRFFFSSALSIRARKTSESRCSEELSRSGIAPPGGGNSERGAVHVVSMFESVVGELGSVEAGEASAEDAATARDTLLDVLSKRGNAGNSRGMWCEGSAEDERDRWKMTLSKREECSEMTL